MSNADHNGGFVASLQDAVRQNPVSAALVGMGVLWMFTGGSRISAAAALLPPAARAAAEGLGSGLSSAMSTAGAAGERLSSAGVRVSDEVRDAVSDAAAATSAMGTQALNAARGGAAGAVSQVKSALPMHSRAAEGVAGALQENLKDTFQRQPLLLGAIGLAIGAGMAAAVRTSQFEAEMMGDTSESVQAQAKEFASTQVDKAADVAQRTFDAVKDEAAAQGLTAQAAKEGAATIGGKIKTVVQAGRKPKR